MRAGVVAVASAGNNADRPFIVGSPSTAARVISVAQTALPDDVLYTITTDAGHHGPQLQAAVLVPGADRGDHRAAGPAGRHPRAARRRTSPTSRPARSR